MEYLYLVKCSTGDEEYYKIGIATEPQSRIASLQTGNPFPLFLVATFEFPNAQVVERAIHQRFDFRRKRGEWFILSEDDISDIHKICRLLGGCNTLEEFGVGASEGEIEQAEDEQELINSIGWRLERRRDRTPPGFAVYQRGKEKKYLAYVRADTLKDPSYPTIEEVEAVLKAEGK